MKDESGKPDAETRTGEDGRFRVEIRAGSEWFAEISPSVQGGRAILAMRHASGPSDEEGADIVLPDACVASGRVVSPDGNAVADADVLVHAKGPNSRNPVAWTTTDATGRFEVAVPAGVEANLVAEPTTRGATGRRWWFGSHVVPPGGATGIELRCAQGKTVTGRVIDAAGSPVAGLTLRFQMPNSTRRTSATSREDGSITCGGLHETIDCDMSVDPDDKAHAGFLVSPNSVSPRSAEPVTFTVGPPATARGRIVDSSGAPVANWSIWLLPTAGGSEYGARTDAEGRFTAKPLPAGRYRVKVVWVPNRERERPHIVGEVETGADEVRFIYPETIVR